MQRYAVSPDIYDQSLPQIVTAVSITMTHLMNHPLSGTETILDACCGTGKLAEYLGEYYPDTRVIGMDNAINMIEFARQHHARKNVCYQLEDLCCYNKTLKQSADLIVCSWALSHIPAEKQTAFMANLFHYLKPEGTFIVLFPVMGSLLATTIQEISQSGKWRDYFKTYENTRMTFTAEQYDAQLLQTGFMSRNVGLRTENVVFENVAQLDCFIMTSLARYLPSLNPDCLRDEFIRDISLAYRSKVNAGDRDIPYQLNLLTAIAKRPAPALLHQRGHAPIQSSPSLETEDYRLNILRK